MSMVALGKKVEKPVKLPNEFWAAAKKYPMSFSHIVRNWKQALVDKMLVPVRMLQHFHQLLLLLPPVPLEVLAGPYPLGRRE